MTWPISGTRRIRESIKAWESSFLGSWSLFALAALPGTLSAGWALTRLSAHLQPIDFSEWAVLTVALTVIGAVSQFGIKPAYMQYVTDHGSALRLPGLRSSMLLLFGSGVVAGSLLGIVFYSIHLLGGWQNTAALLWLPLVLGLGNTSMVLHTDLRILGKSSFIALIAFIQTGCFIAFLELSFYLTQAPLSAFYISTAFTSLVFVVCLSVYTGILRESLWDSAFVKWAIELGRPVMLALLLKYASDMVTASSFRWLTSEVSAGQFGASTKLIEPFMSLYIGSFQMAWGAFVYGWIKTDPSLQLVSGQVMRYSKAFAVAIPVGAVFLFLMHTISQPPFTLSELGPFMAMCLSRAIAFGMCSPLGFGQTVERNYRLSLRINGLEFLLTLSLVPLACLGLGPMAGLMVAAALPWISVYLLYKGSLELLAQRGPALPASP